MINVKCRLDIIHEFVLSQGNHLLAYNLTIQSSTFIIIAMMYDYFNDYD